MKTNNYLVGEDYYGYVGGTGTVSPEYPSLKGEEKRHRPVGFLHAYETIEVAS